MTNLNSVTYLSLHHTHLLVAHVLLIIKLHTNIRQKFFSSSPPTSPMHWNTFHTRFFIYLILFNCYYFLDSSCNWKCIQCMKKKITKLEIKHIQHRYARKTWEWPQLFQEGLKLSYELCIGKTPNIYFHTFTQESRCHKVHKQMHHCTTASCK